MQEATSEATSSEVHPGRAVLGLLFLGDLGGAVGFRAMARVLQNQGQTRGESNRKLDSFSFLFVHRNLTTKPVHVCLLTNSQDSMLSDAVPSDVALKQ